MKFTNQIPAYLRLPVQLTAALAIFWLVMTFDWRTWRLLPAYLPSLLAMAIYVVAFIALLFGTVGCASSRPVNRRQPLRMQLEDRRRPAGPVKPEKVE